MNLTAILSACPPLAARALSILSPIAASLGLVTAAPASKPNIILIMVDDMGLGDAGCYGGKIIQTPNIDSLAKEGMLLSNAYSGSSVCAPSRCVLMTGRHTGHCSIRANKELKGEGQTPMTEGYTIASVLKKAGYTTGLFGKWGLGFPGSPSEPSKSGFDHFFGYNCQRHAHTYYPDWLHDDGNIYQIPENKGAEKIHTGPLIKDRTLKFIEDNKARPFFCYAAWTMPHGKYTAPDLGRFADQNWPKDVKNYAAMVELVDTHVGEVRAKLKQLGIEKNTLLVFTSDNGTNQEFVKTLASSGGLRGTKRSLYEGGIRTPFVASWPRVIPAGRTSGHLTGHVDMLATFAEMSGAKVPENDGISILSTLTGKGAQPPREFLYWEFYEGKFQQALRSGQWKAYREHSMETPVELYDLTKDPHEDHNLAADHPDLVKKFSAIMKEQHHPNPLWSAPGKEGGKKKAAPKDKRPGAESKAG